MAFVVEDGTGLPNANSLCSVAFADEYFADRGVSTWTGSDSVKQSALIRATDYIESRWSGRFSGERQFTADPAQALSFPRTCTDAAAEGEVPDGIKKATSEYALRTLGGDTLAPDPTTNASGLQLSGFKEKVGPLETEEQYRPGSPAVYKSYPAADALVRPFLVRASGLVRG